MPIEDLHSLLNHFTIGTLYIGIIFDLVGALSNAAGLRRFGWDALRIGIVCGVLSILTGFISKGKELIPPEAASLVSYHELLAIVSFLIIAVAVVIRYSAKEKFLDTARGAGVRGGYLALMVVGFILSSTSMVLGSHLVREQGIGVRPMERIREAMPPAVNGKPQWTIPADTATKQ